MSNQNTSNTQTVNTNTPSIANTNTMRTAAQEVQKQIQTLEAKVKIDEAKAWMRENFDACTIEIWFNEAWAKYQGVGIGQETFCIHALNIIKENKFLSGRPLIQYENESPAQFLTKIKKAYKVTAADKYNQVFSDKMKELPIEEATRMIIAVFAKDDENEVRESLILKQLNHDERASAQAILESLKTLNEINTSMNRQTKTHIELMKELAYKIELTRNEGRQTTKATQNVNMLTAEPQNMVNRLNALELQMSEISVNAIDNTNRMGGAGNQNNHRRNNEQNYAGPSRYYNQNNGGRGGYSNSREYNNRWSNERGSNGRGAHSSNWRNRNNQGPERRGNGPAFKGAKVHPYECNICPDHQNKERNSPDIICQRGCKYNVAKICYKHKRYGVNATDTICEGWCQLNCSKNA